MGTLFAFTLSMAVELHQDEVKALREQGRIVPLTALIEQAQSLHPGRLLEAELERHKGRLIYELEILDAGGTVWKLEYEASTGILLEAGRKDND